MGNIAGTTSLDKDMNSIMAKGLEDIFLRTFRQVLSEELAKTCKGSLGDKALETMNEYDAYDASGARKHFMVQASTLAPRVPEVRNVLMAVTDGPRMLRPFWRLLWAGRKVTRRRCLTI